MRKTRASGGKNESVAYLNKKQKKKARKKEKDAQKRP